MTTRKTLPKRRPCETFSLKHGGQLYHVTAGYYYRATADYQAVGEVGEVFISTNKVGTDIESMGRDLAVLMSLAVQHGCSFETMRNALTREHDGSPATIAGAVADRLGVYRRLVEVDK